LTSGQGVKPVEFRITDNLKAHRIATAKAIREGRYGEAENICHRFIDPKRYSIGERRFRDMHGDVLIIQGKYLTAVEALAIPEGQSSRVQAKLWFAKALSGNLTEAGPHSTRERWKALLEEQIPHFVARSLTFKPSMA
jgi:hypothetical protein